MGLRGTTLKVRFGNSYSRFLFRLVLGQARQVVWNNQ